MPQLATQQQPISATIGLAEAGQQLWDVIVIGAGVAGSVAAHQLARRGKDVLLVDRASFPRDKVCGCCLNAHALDALRECGLAGVVRESGAKSLSRFHCCWRRRRVELQVAGGAALSRSALDAALIDSAVAAGAEFLASTTAAVHDCDDAHRHVVFSSDGEDSVGRGRLIVVADGLSGHSTDSSRKLASSVDRRGRIGAHTILTSADDHYPDDTITMVCGQGGYVGLVRLEDDRLNVAGAFDVSAVRSFGSPATLAASILESASMPVPVGLADSSWHGTPRMTHRRKQVAAERLLVIGDAAGYIEPFTGEGMAWAVQSALLAAPLAEEAIHAWSPRLAQCWNRAYRRAFGRRQWLCYATTRLLRNDAGIAALFAVLQHSPWLANRIARYVHGDNSAPRLTPQMQST